MVDKRRRKIIFATPRLRAREEEVINRIEEMRRGLAHVVRDPKRWTGVVRRMAMARAIQGSNSIEGIHVSLDDAMAAVVDEEPHEARREVFQAVKGYRDALTYIVQLADDPHFEYGPGLLRSLHFIMMQHDELTKRPGQWRLGDVFVFNESTGERVYEGPPAETVPELVGALVAELKDDSDSPVLVEAAMAHLNLVMIHPFKDGNGRMARALQTLVLARGGILAPEFSSLEEYLGANQSAYYDVLETVGEGHWQPSRDARPWVRFTLKCHYHQALTLQRRVKEWASVWELVELLAGREGLPERTCFALFDGAFGSRIRNASYRLDADVSQQTAGRDLKLLVEHRLLVPRGERRGRYYDPSERLLAIRDKARSAEPAYIDPFEEAA
jgi:Fic family protein